MSRSYKKAILKDKGMKKTYWRTVRRVINQAVKNSLTNPDIIIPIPKQIINDYDYCDYIIDYEFDRNFSYGKNYNEDFWKNKFKRK